MTEAERGQLVRRVERGDADALQRLLVEYYAALHQFVAVRLELGLRARVEPEDVLQEACVAAFRAVAGTGRDQGSKGSRARGSGDQGIAGSRDRRSGDGTGDADGEAAEPSGSVGDKGAAGARNAEAADEGVAKAGGDGQDVGTGRLVFAGPAQFYGWLERIVRSKLGEARRAARRQKRDVGREAGGGRDLATTCTGLIAQLRASSTTPSRALSRKEAVALLQIALARLPEVQRTVVRLRFLEDVPVAEIAQRLGKGEMAVYQAIHRGLKRLGGMLSS